MSACTLLKFSLASPSLGHYGLGRGLAGAAVVPGASLCFLQFLGYIRWPELDARPAHHASLLPWHVARVQELFNDAAGSHIHAY